MTTGPIATTSLRSNPSLIPHDSEPRYHKHLSPILRPRQHIQPTQTQHPPTPLLSPTHLWDTAPTSRSTLSLSIQFCIDYVLFRRELLLLRASPVILIIRVCRLLIFNALVV